MCPDEVFTYYYVPVGDLFRRDGKGLFVPVRLAQILAIEGAGKRYFALRPATDCTNIASYGRTMPPGTALPADLAKYRFRHSYRVLSDQADATSGSVHQSDG
jgi:hypothetical protein